ncbi:MAG: hypothetical protein E7Z63_00865 [Thermoplasmata archaeon]|nr:hypothetical protein [Thermoplasmata archaeon]
MGFSIGDGDSLAEVNPELALEWHPIKNGGLLPTSVKYYSRNRVWWRCSGCGYEWRTIIAVRSRGAGCPNCARNKGKYHD